MVQNYGVKKGWGFCSLGKLARLNLVWFFSVTHTFLLKCSILNILNDDLLSRDRDYAVAREEGRVEEREAAGRHQAFQPWLEPVA